MDAESPFCMFLEACEINFHSEFINWGNVSALSTCGEAVGTVGGTVGGTDGGDLDPKGVDVDARSRNENNTDFVFRRDEDGSMGRRCDSEDRMEGWDVDDAILFNRRSPDADADADADVDVVVDVVVDTNAVGSSAASHRDNCSVAMAAINVVVVVADFMVGVSRKMGDD